MSKVRNIRVDDPTWERWQVKAGELGLTTSSLVRLAMHEKIGGGNIFAATRITMDELLDDNEHPPVPTQEVRTPVVPTIPGVKKASDIPMPKLDKYVPKPQPKKVGK